MVATSRVEAQPLKHRPEIDGLRAVAVVTVMLFHADLGFSGGYVGVDVFFVISGFLISSLIWKDLATGRFTIADFWERRVRRILPALVVTVAACLATGWFVLLPRDLTQLGRSTVAQALLVSNLFFWKSAGYFAAEARPLLHTWSLAVEEQFYLAYPLFLVVMARFGRPAVAAAMVVATAISFRLNIHWLHVRPPSAFYLLPSRAWELLLGSILAVFPVRVPSVRAIRELLGAAGLAAILFAAVRYDKNTPFPGFAAVLPCAGTALIIWTSGKPTVVARALSLRPVVFLGFISYSLYLWHWPLLVYGRYWLQDRWSGIDAGAMLAASAVFAVLSWKFVETPIRRRTAFPGRARIFAIAGVSLGLLVAAGTAVWRAGGAPGRWPAESLKYVAAKDDWDFRNELGLKEVREGRLVELGGLAEDRPIDLLVWGDSHAMAVLHVLDVMCAERGVRGVAATHSATAPLLDHPDDDPESLGEDLIPWSRAVADFVRDRHVKTVLLVALWAPYALEARFPEFLDKTVATLRNAGARVFIMKDVPFWPFDVPTALAVAAAQGRDVDRVGGLVADFRAKEATTNAFLDALAAKAPVVTLDPTPYFADPSGFYHVQKSGRAIYFDRHHLSTYGSTQLRPMFEPLFEPASQRGR